MISWWRGDKWAAEPFREHPEKVWARNWRKRCRISVTKTLITIRQNNNYCRWSGSSSFCTFTIGGQLQFRLIVTIAAIERFLRRGVGRQVSLSLERLGPVLIIEQETTTFETIAVERKEGNVKKHFGSRWNGFRNDVGEQLFPVQRTNHWKMNYLGDVVPSLNIGVFWDTLFNNFPIFSKMTSYEYPIGWLMFNFDLEDSAPLKNFSGTSKSCTNLKTVWEERI